MRPVDPPLTVAIEAPERTTRIRLSVDWDGDGHGPRGSIDDLSGTAAAVTVGAVLSTTLPDQVAVVEGTAAATLSADLTAGDTADERLTAVRYFSPASTSSPLAGKQRLGRDVECDVEVLTATGWQAVPLLRGVSRAMPASVARRTATLDVIDRRHRLRTPVQLPVMVADGPTLGVGDPSKPGLEGAWVVSYVLWQCGYPLSPPARPGCRLWIPFHGSAVPFIARPFAGSPTSSIQGDGRHRRLAFDPGPFVLGTRRTTGGLHTSVFVLPADGAPMFAANGRSTGRVEMWIRRNGNESPGVNVLIGLFSSVTVRINGLAQLELELNNNGSVRTVAGPTVPADDDWRLTGVHWDDTAGRAVFRISASSTLVTFTPTVASSGIEDIVDTTVTSAVPIADLHVTTGLTESDDWLPTAWTAGAVVDRPQLRDLDGIAAADPMEGWALLQGLAAAEQGAVWCDADGRPHYATRARLNSPAAQSPQRVLTAQQHLLELAYDLALDQVRNIVRCPYQPIIVVSQTRAWELRATIAVTPGETLAFLAAASLATPVATVGGAANTDPGGAGTPYIVSLFSAQVPATLTRVSATAVLVTVRNATGATVWLVDTDGRPALYVQGDVVEQETGADPPVFRDQASIDTYGDQPLDMPASRWIQRRDVAHGMAMVTGLDLGQPRPVLTGLEIPGDPRLEPYDRLTVSDPDNTEIVDDFWLLGARHRLDAAGDYTQQLSGRNARTRFVAGPSGAAGEDLVG